MCIIRDKLSKLRNLLGSRQVEQKKKGHLNKARTLERATTYFAAAYAASMCLIFDSWFKSSLSRSAACKRNALPVSSLFRKHSSSFVFSSSIFLNSPTSSVFSASLCSNELQQFIEYKKKMRAHRPSRCARCIKSSHKLPQALPL